MIETSGHLAECEWNDETRVNRRCICPALRACEARVTTPSHYHDLGYAAGVQAARDAVVAAYENEDYAHHDSWGVPVVYKSLMLAAIDGLQTDTKTSHGGGQA